MSDPRQIDPRRRDPVRRFDLPGSSSGGMILTWLAAIIAIVIVVGLVIGYSRTDQASLRSKEPTTTGSAPSGMRHAPRAVPAPARPSPPVTPDRDL